MNPFANKITLHMDFIIPFQYHFKCNKCWSFNYPIKCYWEHVIKATIMQALFILQYPTLTKYVQKDLFGQEALN
jgi:hypothetical protein